MAHQLLLEHPHEVAHCNRSATNVPKCEVTHLDDGAKLGDGDPLPGHGVFGLRGSVALVGAPPD